MDNITMILFGCVLCTITGLNFMELRKIRKNLERSAGQMKSGTPAAVGPPSR
jgi:hypothetical protein